MQALSHPGKYVATELFGRNEKKKDEPTAQDHCPQMVEAKNSTAMLTTFNEVDMSRIMEIRSKYKENSKKRTELV